MQFSFAYAPPLIIGATVNCKVFDILEGGRKTLEQVGHTTGASERGLRALMKASGPGVFTANSGDKILIKNRLLIREAKCFHLIR